MELISIILAVIAFVFSFVTYLVHDRRLKKQELLLNAYQLRSLSQEEEKSKRAVIRAKAVKLVSGQRKLYIGNVGNAVARNLRVDMLDNAQVIATRPNMPMTYAEVLPNATREITLMLTSGNDELTLSYEWEDEYSRENKESQTIDL